MPDWWQQLNGLIVETLLEWESHAQAWAEQWEAWDNQLEEMLWEWETPLAEAATWLEEILVQPLARTLEPLVMEQPACVGCKHYHGQVYNGQILVCAMHPYGVEGTSCPDWEGFWS
ncbi:MAG: hypothetical protein RMI89_02535 [Gloeomargarita sp. SKYBB_i_bin120]|nr:hypothetical protein [Gloeomargarita sp. SKYG98]MCS7291837.1 hypothetical protein [Gloeomargarita sp. SKYB120]MDW8177397.1 hypothetical protein [Gloeomargarita sp. SKYBB_i_bin120]